MFDEKSRYDAHDVDLTQTITESMLKTVYEAHNLNLLICITEIESNDDEHEVEKIDEKFSTSSFHSLDKTSTSEISKNQLVLSFSSSSRSVSKSISLSIDNKKKESEKEKKKMIELDLDQANIFSKKMFRNRALKKQVYMTNLINAAHEEIAVYHITFFAFLEAKHYYLLKTVKISSKSSLKDSSQRLHRDYLFSKSINYRQMLIHSHVMNFREALKTKLIVLRQKKI